MRALLGHDLPQLDGSAVDRPPQAPAVASMEKTIAFLSKSRLHTVLQYIVHTVEPVHSGHCVKKQPAFIIATCLSSKWKSSINIVYYTPL
jgi:hypothetical protein